MYSRNILLSLLAAMSVSAVPLNINLGAYSPALVVGDGEISFGGTQNAGELMETLASGAATAAGTRAATAAAAPAAANAVVVPPIAASAERPVAAPVVDKAVAAPVEASQPTDGVIGNRVRDGLDPSLPFPNIKRALIVRSDQEARNEQIKRDITGFREALSFARDAMKNQPKVELGSENAGVGIVVSPGVNVPANSAANGARPVRRSVESPAVEESRGITLVAIAEI